MDHLDAALYPNQNMNPSCCNAINTKDMECMNYAYPGSLPVALSSFEARLLGNERVELKWVTQTEKNNANFTVQRSTDGLTFEKLAELPGTNATTGGTYAWIDEHPQPGVNYYLLSQTDFDAYAERLVLLATKYPQRIQVAFSAADLKTQFYAGDEKWVPGFTMDEKPRFLGPRGKDSEPAPPLVIP